MFALSKALALFTEPLVYVAAILVAGIVSQFFAVCLARAACVAASATLFALGFEALPNALVQRLESTYVAAPNDLSGYSGMVILGGAFTSADGSGIRYISINHEAERAIVPVALLRTFPRLKILFSGGDGEQSTRVLRPEADRARVFFDAMGVPASAVIYERDSRTTAENAVFSARLAGIDVRAPWLLVTSAWHMPRSLAAFHKAGWSNITALPVDFRSSADLPVLSYSLGRSLSLWRIVLHEYAGVVWYRANGIA